MSVYAAGFPDSPAQGDTHPHGDLTYRWNGKAWTLVTGGSSGGSGGIFGPDFPTYPTPGFRYVSEDMIDYVWTGDEWVQVNALKPTVRNVGMLDDLDA